MTITMKHTNINSGGSKMATETPGINDDPMAAARDSLRVTDDASKAVQKTPHRATLDSIIAKIRHVDYENPERHPHMTIAVVTMQNGFIIIGKSAPADPKNFDETLGKKFAYEDAVRQIWPFEGYLLREKLSTPATMEHVDNGPNRPGGSKAV